MKKIKVFVNGFGRIGRCIARVILTSKNDRFEIVGINDPADSEVLAYLLEHDSIHFQPLKTKKINTNLFAFNDYEILFSAKSNPSEVEINHADVVIESSGLFLKREFAECYLKKGAKKVILSAPAQDDTPTFVLGVNHHSYKGESIISNASCTTNALAPIVMLLDKTFGVEKGILTTIHSYTNDQNLIDSVHKKNDLRRSRAAAINMIPTTTGAAKALHLVLPEIKGKLHGHSVRVPIPDVSMIDLNINLCQQTTKESLNTLFEEASLSTLQGILGVDKHYGVSQDFIDNPLSVIIASDLTFVLGGNMAKIMAWYDNEWGYSNRILEMAEWICG
ncbi:MAG: type I glyceraldehyde-3-phosphate dehydrogenase [Helicobacter sp.]|nr:type I glyceraldehyde-3-phosphate dehydrogenase [Helicobacter sp.]